MTKRKTLSKKARFEVFKRDSFSCQYCGQSAPDVVLHVDHISPVVGGGGNDIMNLITSCIDCNLGKGAKKLSDKSIIEKQKAQLDELNEKRNQLEMMVNWREELRNMKEIQIEQVEKIVFEGTGHKYSELGKSNTYKLIKKYGLAEILECAEISRTQYIEYKKGQITSESLDKIINYVGKIANQRDRQSNIGNIEDISKLYYIRGIVRNRMFCDEWSCLAILKKGYLGGLSIDEMAEIAKTAANWTDWLAEMEEAMPI